MALSRPFGAAGRRPCSGRALLAFSFIAVFAVSCSGSPKHKELIRDSSAATAASAAASLYGAGISTTPVITTTESATPTPTASMTPTPSPTPEPSPTEPPAPLQTLVDGNHGYAVTSGAVIRAQPNTQSAAVARLAYQQELVLQGRVRGERFVVGSQDWPMAIQDWSNLWYKVDGGYVYSAYVWVPKAGQVLPSSLPAGERWVNVNLATQTAQLMIGDRAVYTADVTSGKNGYETPTGHWRVNYQVLNETMTSGQAGINDPAEHYDVQNVLFTQYFDGSGDALHLNYWQPESVFGKAPTSHGCVGLFVQDAQYFWMFGQGGMRVEINQNGRILPPPAPPPTSRPATAVATATPRPAAAPVGPVTPTSAPTPAAGTADESSPAAGPSPAVATAVLGTATPGGGPSGTATAGSAFAASVTATQGAASPVAVPPTLTPTPARAALVANPTSSGTPVR